MRSWDKPPGPEILLTTLSHASGLDLPAYATDRSVGMDLAAAIENDILIEPGQKLCTSLECNFAKI